MKFVLVFAVVVLGLCGVFCESEESARIIRDEDRRGANIDNHQVETHKRSLFSFSSHGGHKSSFPSGYGNSGPSGYGYSGNSGHGYSSYGPPSAHGYEYDEYGHTGHTGQGGYGGHVGHAQYGGGGGGEHIQHSGGEHNGLYLKKLLIPLAGIALLGAAAALSTNPVLLQLGVVNGRRRRRSIENAMMRNVYPTHPKIKPHVYKT